MSDDGKLLGEYGKVRTFERLDAERERRERQAGSDKLKAILVQRLAGPDESTKVAGKPAQQPSLGRVVHYTPDVGEPGLIWTATICKVHPFGAVNLGGYTDTGEPFKAPNTGHTDAPAGSEEALGKWSWPAHVPPKPAG